jgi:hypothetical protein
MDASLALILIVIFFLLTIPVLKTSLSRRSGAEADSDAGTSQSAPTGEPRCGNCGYIVRGIASLICPECGADLREAGIDVGRLRSKLPPWSGFLIAFIIWSIALLIVAEPIIDAFEKANPPPYQLNLAFDFVSPGSKAYLKITASMSDTISGSFQQSWTPRSVNYALYLLDGNTTELKVDFKNDRYEYVQSAGRVVRESGAFNSAIMLDWLKASGIDSSNPQVAGEVGEVIAASGKFPSGWGANVGIGTSSWSSGGTIFQTFGSGNMGGSIRPGNSTIAMKVSVALVALWLLGIWFFSRLFWSKRNAVSALR